MKIIDEAAVCAGILQNFLDVYQHHNLQTGYTLPLSSTRQKQYDALKDAQPLSKKKVLEIVPEFADSFLHTCSECEGKYSTVIEVGEYLDYESRTAWLCKHCINNAMKLIHPGPPV